MRDSNDDPGKPCNGPGYNKRPVEAWSAQREIKVNTIPQYSAHKSSSVASNTMSNADETPPLEKKQPPSSPWNSPSASPPSSTDTVSYDRHCLLTENADNIRTMFRLERLAALEEDNKRLKAKSKHLEEDNEHLKEDQAKSKRLKT